MALDSNGAAGKGQESVEVQKRREELKNRREEMGLFKTPFRTLQLFAVVAFENIRDYSLVILTHKASLLVVYPLLAIWAVTKLHLYPEAYADPVCGDDGKEPASLWWAELWLTEAAWWITLGVLSSVGFGTGLHSGLMFLFPHIMQIVFAAEGCKSLVGMRTEYLHPCKLTCGSEEAIDDGTVTFLALVLKAIVPCMLWGAGTAVGELPPYAISKAARLAGRADENMEAELEEARNSHDVVSRLKVWTIDFTNKHGFFGVFLLAAWPNAAFDMCGMCCGYLLMPFWTFFIAVLLGKGVAKVSGQAVFFISLFGKPFFDVILTLCDQITALLKSFGQHFDVAKFAREKRQMVITKFNMQARLSLPDLLSKHGKDSKLSAENLKEIYKESKDVDAMVSRIMEVRDVDKDGFLSDDELRNLVAATDDKISLGDIDPEASGYFKMIWDLFLVCLVIYFFVSIIEQLAETKQVTIDEEELSRLAAKSPAPAKKRATTPSRARSRSRSPGKKSGKKASPKAAPTKEIQPRLTRSRSSKDSKKDQ